MQMPSNLNFGELYQLLPKKITPVMATNLSAPIAFVTLLHLCNERVCFDISFFDIFLFIY